MTNNDVLRRIRYIFDLNDAKMMAVFLKGGKEQSRAQISDWLKPEAHPEFKSLFDIDLATFLNGFITEKRGKKEGEQPKPEKTLNNNLVLRKLKIALALKTDDMVAILKLADMRVSPHEITAFFRKPSQRQYQQCKDQFLRNFLMGLQLKYRPKAKPSSPNRPSFQALPKPPKFRPKEKTGQPILRYPKKKG